jgi:uncharacterized protein
MATTFTPGSALVGGALIGAAATLLWAVNGRTAGVSGILGGVLRPVRGEVAGQLSFLLGLLLVGVVAGAIVPEAFGRVSLGWGGLVLAGLCVGVGTRLGGGCTSGHGVCGISRGSRRSIVATITFMATAVVTVAVARVVGGGR